MTAAASSAPRPSSRLRKPTKRKQVWTAPPEERWALLDSKLFNEATYRREEIVEKTPDGGQICITVRGGCQDCQTWDDVFGIVVDGPPPPRRRRR